MHNEYLEETLNYFVYNKCKYAVPSLICGVMFGFSFIQEARKFYIIFFIT